MDAEFQIVTETRQIERVVQLASDIWIEHYTPIIGRQQVDYMLEKFQSKQAIQEQILNQYKYYLICSNDTDNGYLAIKEEPDGLFISKIYVAKEFRGTGLGKAAMDFIFSQALNIQADRIWLTVNKYNKGSIKAYEKLGFKNVESLVMDIGDGYVMDDYRMVKELTT